MAFFKLRPTFVLPLRDSREVAIERLREACERVGDLEAFRMFGEYGELHLHSSEHRLWSPHLSFYVADTTGADKLKAGDAPVAVIHGRFAPRVDIWTVVWIVYLAMAISAFYGFTLAFSQWMLGESGWGLWVAACSMLVIAAVTVTAAVGQQLSADQMLQLKERLEQLLADARLKIAQQPDSPSGVQSRLV